ncbi:response regulator [Massilia sp. IC2-278]|uniref:response regulator n=1 Tax=Massilia sp. IC2-278 TaxID=2887200 RepID=UPI001E4C9C7C|nr:response regulator [Massilia sp. IC2-278]MCC2959581.1 response regulator [Massilia sp. IC2-278]
MTNRLLLVDDVAFDVDLTCRVLRSCGIEHEIVRAFDGEEALALLQRDPDFDLILLDLKLPKLNGFELMECLLAQAPSLEIPIIVLSGSNLDTDRTRADALGAADYVVKAMYFAEYRRNLQAALARFAAC